MMVNVFDDRKGSVAHILAGGLTRFVPVTFVIFIAYEFIEHVYLRGKEREANFLGDIFEYSFGAMLMTIFFELLGCIGIAVFFAFVAGLWYIMGKWK
jgi:hypothetical protein